MSLDFEKSHGRVPAIIQDAVTNQVLMLGFMNEEAYQKTLDEGKVTFWSRTKERLWTKGETSGHFLHVVDIKEDCDKDTLLVRVKPAGPTCHTGTDTCWGEENKGRAAFLNQLQAVIKDRKENPSDESYTSSLFKSGINKVAQKVGEEAVEVVIEAKDDNKDLFLNESADLLYHLLVLLEAKGVDLDEVVQVLEERHK